jgi:K+/H+ antiporter YhaU regulatory subunit KhtT
MQSIDPLYQRPIASSFYLTIPLDKDPEEIEQLISNAIEIENVVDVMLNGSMTLDELMEAVEPFVPSIDDYSDEVEGNLEDALVVCQCLPAWLND